MFGIKLRLAGDNQGTIGTRGQSPATGNRTGNRTSNRTIDWLRLSDDWRKSIVRLV